MAKTRYAASTGIHDPQKFNLYRSPEPFGYSTDGYRSCHCSGSSSICICCKMLDLEKVQKLKKDPRSHQQVASDVGPKVCLVIITDGGFQSAV